MRGGDAPSQHPHQDNGSQTPGNPEGDAPQPQTTASTSRLR